MPYARPTVISLVLAAAVGVAAGGCGGSHPSPFTPLRPGVVMPRGIRAIAITTASGRQPPSVHTTITAPRTVRTIVSWVDRMPRVPPGVYNCPGIEGIEPTISLSFRASAAGRVLASGVETDTGSGSSTCNPLTVTIPGHGHRDLIAGRFLERIERLTGVRLGFGFGRITGTISYGGGARLPTPRRALLPATAHPYEVDVYLADPAAFSGSGDGLLIGVFAGRSGRFSTRMAPGRYLLRATTNGQAPRCAPVRVTVRVGQTVRADPVIGCEAK